MPDMADAFPYSWQCKESVIPNAWIFMHNNKSYRFETYKGRLTHVWKMRQLHRGFLVNLIRRIGRC